MKLKTYSLCLLVFCALAHSNLSSSSNEQSAFEEVEPQQFSGVLASHNTVRAKYNQQPLAWSNALSDYAQLWVNHLAATQNCEMIHRPNYEGEYDSDRFLQVHGENLFWASATIINGGEKKLENYAPAEVVAAWADEEHAYDYQSNSCQDGQICGHFTQMIWHESRQVGCAKAICPDKSQIWACNYHPRGNYIGERPY